MICEVALAEIAPALTPGDAPQFLADWNLTFAPSSQASALLAAMTNRSAVGSFPNRLELRLV